MMKFLSTHIDCDGVAATPSPRTRHVELLRLCARIGYSPHGNP